MVRRGSRIIIFIVLNIEFVFADMLWSLYALRSTYSMVYNTDTFYLFLNVEYRWFPRSSIPSHPKQESKKHYHLFHLTSDHPNAGMHTKYKNVF